MANIDQIADDTYRINHPIQIPGGGGFSFNQYLVIDEEPLLFHTGLRGGFEETRDAVSRVTDPAKLRYIAFSHFEADECGALNQLLAIAPGAVPVCSRVAALTSINDQADRPPKPLTDGEELRLGKHTLSWFDTPHLPHGWETGYMFDRGTNTLFCGDLFTQPGDVTPALTGGDILGPSEAFRTHMDYFSYGRDCGRLLARLAATHPTTLACMHGSAWQGDGGRLLLELAATLSAARA